MRYLGFGIEVLLIPLGLCNTNLNETDEFSINIFPTMKNLKSLVESYSDNQILILKEQLCLCSIWIFIFDTD